MPSLIIDVSRAEVNEMNNDPAHDLLMHKVKRLEQENDAFRRANEHLHKELGRLRELLDGVDAELDRAPLDPDRTCRPIIHETLRTKISEAVAEWTDEREMEIEYGADRDGWVPTDQPQR